MAMDLTFKVREHQKHVQRRVKPVDSIQDLSGVGPKSVVALQAENVHTLDQLFERYKDGGRPWLRKLLPFGVHWKKVESSIQAAVV